jgi:hypothetical protein
MSMVYDIKHRRWLNFCKIIQSWDGNEDKKVDIEFIKLKVNCPICMDEIKLETSTLCGHFFFLSGSVFMV